MTQYIDNYEDTSTWGESLKRYTHSRLTPLQLDEPVFTFSRSKSYMWRCAPKNPVLGIYNKPEDESEYQKKEATKLVKKLNYAKDQQLKKEAGFDLVSHKSRREGLDKTREEKKEKLKQQRLEERRKHGPHPSRECKHDFDSELGKRKKLSELRERSTWNLVTHEFFKAPEEKRAIEKKSRLDKTWRNYDRYQTDRFDPILQRFVEPEKEKVLKRIVKDVSKSRKVQHQEALPPTLRKAQPQAYHMITGKIFNKKLTQDWDKKAKVSMNRFSKKRETENRFKREQNKKQKVALQRTLNRHQNPTRSRDQVRHGYHIITNQGFDGPKSVKPLVSLEVMKPTSMWNKIQRPKSVGLNRNQRRSSKSSRPPTASALSRACSTRSRRNL